jgi:hypothetical protein
MTIKKGAADDFTKSMISILLTKLAGMRRIFGTKQAVIKHCHISELQPCFVINDIEGFNFVDERF